MPRPSWSSSPRALLRTLTLPSCFCEAFTPSCCASALDRPASSWLPASAPIDELGRAIQFTCKLAYSIDHLQHPCNWRSTFLIRRISCPIDCSMATREYKSMKTKRSVWRPVNTLPHSSGRYVWRPVSTQSHLCEGKENEKLGCNMANLCEEMDHSPMPNDKIITAENDSGSNPDRNGAGSLEVQSSSQGDAEKSENVSHACSSSMEKCVTEGHLECEASGEVVKTNQESSVITTELEYSVKSDQGGDGKECTETLESCTTVPESVETTRYSRTVKVDSSLLRFVKGGKPLKSIQETGVKISIISTKGENSIVVDGPSIESVTAAAEKIQQILDEAVKSSKLQYSHFISLPLAVHPALVEKLANFQKSILELVSRIDKEEEDFKGASNEESSAEDSCEDADDGPKVAVQGNVEDDERADVAVKLNVQDDNVFVELDVAEASVKCNVEDDTEHVKIGVVEIPAENVSSEIQESFSQEKGSENLDEQADIAVKLNVEDDSVCVKLDVPEIPAGDVLLKPEQLLSEEKVGENSDEREDVAAKLNVEDDNVSVMLDAADIPAGDVHGKPKTLLSQTKHDRNSDEREDVAVKFKVEDDNVSVKLDVAEIPAGEVHGKPKTSLSQRKDGKHSDEREDVAVKLNVEDDNVSVKLDVVEIPDGEVHLKSQRLPVENSKKRADVAVKLTVEDQNVYVKLDAAESPIGDAHVMSKSLLPHGKKNLGIDKSIFIKPQMFHLTVLMLKLWNNERIAAAAETLQKISPQVKEALEGRSVAVSLRGLKCMKGKASRAHVLYAPVEEVGSEGRLLRACQVIIDAFLEAGLALEKDAKHPLKLHATVMNTSHRKQKRRYRRPLHFDARPILELYGSEDWGEYVIHEAHLSQRFSYDENGYYHRCASIPFPEIAQDDDVQ